jgi:hypothetical protein
VSGAGHLHRARKCWLCSAQAVDGSLCAYHRAARDEYKRAEVGYRRGHYRCGKCGKLGHNARRCPTPLSSD